MVGLKYMIIILVAIVVIILLTVLLIFVFQGGNGNVDEYGDQDDATPVLDPNVQAIPNEAAFFTVSDIINTSLAASGPGLEFTAIEMRLLEGERVNTYSVYGVITEIETGRLVRFMYVIVSIDMQNATFVVEPIEEDRYSNIDEIELELRYESIEEQENNRFRGRNPIDEDIVNAFFEIYRYTALYNTRFAFGLLDEDFRAQRFGSLGEFETFAQNNTDRIRNARISRFAASETEAGRRFSVIDQNGNSYIFIETGAMQFTVILDAPTPDLPEF